MQHDQMVGKYFQEGRTSWVPGSFFTMIGPECRLDLFWDNISSEDVWRVSNGKVSFGVWYSEDRDLFFLYRFEGCHWSDTVFSAMTLPEEKRIRRPFMHVTEKLELLITMVSTETGKIMACRTLTFSHPLSKKLCLAVDKHFYANYIKTWNESNFVERVARVYQTYPLPEMITKAQGCILCTGQENVLHPPYFA